MTTENTNEIFDLSGFGEEFAEAKPFAKFDPMKDGVNQSGPITFQLNRMWLKPDEKEPSKILNLNWSSTVLTGPQTGATIYRKNRIVKGDSKSFSRLVTDLQTVGITTKNVDDLQKDEVKAIALGKVIEGAVKVNPKDTRYYDLQMYKTVQA